MWSCFIEKKGNSQAVCSPNPTWLQACTGNQPDMCTTKSGAVVCQAPMVEAGVTAISHQLLRPPLHGRFLQYKAPPPGTTNENTE
jgi:hypothetical protein